MLEFWDFVPAAESLGLPKSPITRVKRREDGEILSSFVFNWLPW